jgi:peptidoglycan/LPS O-acetylase OafA/YrhL
LAGLRFLAAGLVVLMHYGMDFSGTGAAPLRSIISRGGVSVALFFVLSGFVLTYTYLNVDGTPRGGVRAFLVARFARIYPVYAFAWLVTGLLTLYRHGLTPPEQGRGLAALLLIQAWLPPWVLHWNPASWSLSVEAFFYALFPLLVLPIGRLTSRQLSRVFGILWIICLAVPLIYLIFKPDGTRYITDGPDSFWLLVINFNPLGRLPEFVMGMITARWFMLARTQTQDPGVRGRFRFPALWSTASGSAIVLFLAFAPTLPLTLLNDTLLLPLFTILIYNLAWGEGWLAGALSLGPVVLLGEASYGLYILHQPTLDWAKSLLHVSDAVAQHSALYFAAFVCFVVALSVLVLRTVEQPSRAGIKRILHG